MDGEIYALSDPELVTGIGSRFKDYRIRYGKTQKQIAESTGLSIFTISSFEAGKATGITLLNFIRLLRAIEELEGLGQLLPELPDSPRMMFKAQQKKKTKVRNNGK